MAAADLWPDVVAATGRKYLSYHLFVLRKRMADVGLDDVAVDVGRKLALAQNIGVDVGAFDRHVAGVTTTTSVGGRVLALEQASMLYRGDLLTDFDSAWIERHRSRLATAYGLSMNLLAEATQDDAALRGLMQATAPGAWRTARLQAAGGGTMQGAPSRAQLPLVRTEAVPNRSVDVGAVERFAGEAGVGLAGGERKAWLDRVAAREADIEAALTLAIEDERYASGYAIAVPLWRYWYSTRQAGLGLAWLERLLAAPYVPEASTRAMALHAAGTLAHYGGNSRLALQRLEQAADLWSNLGDDEGLFRTLGNLATVHYHLGYLEEAQVLYDRTNELAEALGDRTLLITGLHDAAICARQRKANATARALSERRLALLSGAGETGALVLPSLVELGAVTLAERRLDAAQEVIERAIRVAGEVGDDSRLSICLTQRGFVAYLRGDAAEAEKWMRESLDVARRTRSPWHEGMALGYLACALELGGRANEAAATMLRATTVLRGTPDNRAVNVLQDGVRELTEGGMAATAG